MSRNFFTHQFSNVSVTQATTTSVRDCAFNLPGGVFKSSGLNSRDRLIFRLRATPLVLTNAAERTLKRMGAVIYIFDAMEQFASVTDTEISRTNTVHATVLFQNLTNNYFNPTPFAFGVPHITHPDTPADTLPLYPSGTTEIYSWITEVDVEETLTAQEVKDFIDQLATGIGTVDVIKAPDPDGTVRTYVHTNYGFSAWYQADNRAVGNPMHSSTNTLALPDWQNTQVDVFLKDAYNIVLEYGGPLRTTLSSITTPPVYDISDNYRFDMDTLATD